MLFPGVLSALKSSTASSFQVETQQDGKARDGAPPYALMEAPPLAVFANGVAAALNELRHCPPLVLRGPVTGVLQVKRVCCG